MCNTSEKYEFVVARGKNFRHFYIIKNVNKNIKLYSYMTQDGWRCFDKYHSTVISSGSFHAHFKTILELTKQDLIATAKTIEMLRRKIPEYLI
jgi:hypothetical protein